MPDTLPPTLANRTLDIDKAISGLRIARIRAVDDAQRDAIDASIARLNDRKLALMRRAQTGAVAPDLADTASTIRKLSRRG